MKKTVKRICSLLLLLRLETINKKIDLIDYIAINTRELVISRMINYASGRDKFRIEEKKEKERLPINYNLSDKT